MAVSTFSFKNVCILDIRFAWEVACSYQRYSNTQWKEKDEWIPENRWCI